MYVTQKCPKTSYESSLVSVITKRFCRTLITKRLCHYVNYRGNLTGLNWRTF